MYPKNDPQFLFITVLITIKIVNITKSFIEHDVIKYDRLKQSQGPVRAQKMIFSILCFISSTYLN